MCELCGKLTVEVGKLTSCCKRNCHSKCLEICQAYLKGCPICKKAYSDDGDVHFMTQPIDMGELTRHLKEIRNHIFGPDWELDFSLAKFVPNESGGSCFECDEIIRFMDGGN